MIYNQPSQVDVCIINTLLTLCVSPSLVITHIWGCIFFIVEGKALGFEVLITHIAQKSPLNVWFPSYISQEITNFVPISLHITKGDTDALGKVGC